eukprot:5397443-Amphidinium_carterae.1
MEYKQLFSTASVATELPKGSVQQVLKVALGAQVDSHNINLQELEQSSQEYMWYSMMSEHQFTTYSQGEGRMPTYRMRHAIARFQHSKWSHE